MSRILLTIDKINNLGDVETTFFDIVEYFHGLGWHVDIVARLIENPYQQRLEQMQLQGRIQCFTEDHHPLASCYQLIWICQGYMSGSLISALQKAEISGVCLFHHYHNYADQDLPYGAVLENKIAWRSLAVSTNAYTKLALKGIDQRKLHIFPFSVSDPFCQFPAPASEPVLRKILLISAEQSDEINTLSALLTAQGIALDHISIQRTSPELTPEWLSEYQLVIGQARPVAQALSLGIPAFVSDTTYGGGYINDLNLDDNLDRHFVADGEIRLNTPKEWLQEILEGYEEGMRWARAFRKQAQEFWSLNDQLTHLVASLPAPQRLEIDAADAANLTLHRKVIANDADRSRVLEQWLKVRQPSAARIAVLQAFISQQHEAGDIGLAIIDRDNDAHGVSATRASLEQQHWLVPQVHIVNSVSQLSALVSESVTHSLLVIEAGTLLLPQATLVFAEHCLRQPDVAMWYSDTIVGDNLLQAEALFKPEMNIDLLRSQPYIGNQLLINLAAARDAGGLDSEYAHLSLVDMAWKMVESRGAQSIGHISDVLMQTRAPHQQWLSQPEIVSEAARLTQAHLARCGLSAAVEPGLMPGLHRVRFTHAERPLVSVIVPTRDRLPLLRRCIESLMENTRWPHYELLIVNNASVDQDACEYLQQLEQLGLQQVRILQWPQAFNYAAINNMAAQQARGDLLLFLNNDIHVTDGDWMDAMLEHALRPEVGIVGARLEFSDGRIQHAGICTGIGSGASPVYEGAAGDNAGYLSRLKSVHNVSAVSAACMMMRKMVFEELGGFSDEHFPIYLGDVDLALKARQQGYITVWTPYARLEHMAAATRVLQDKADIEVYPGETVFDALREKWGASLSYDASYNPNLSKSGSNFKLGIRHANYQQPLPGRPLPVMMGCHKNITGSGNYRVMKPFKALEGQLVLEGGLTLGVPSVMEVAQVQPDILLMELIIDPDFGERVKQFRQVSQAKIILEYDDYLPNLPIKSAYRKNVPKDIVSRLRRSIDQADWLVVSTQPLADAYAPFHHDIRVAQNRLGVDLWEPLKSARRQGKKPRVGWAGGTSHTGDLEILLPFMREMENEVEWVFMGMKPKDVKCEFHIGVPFDYYPEKMSTLNLDLALVPLEINQFNECKSNLRLLEMGACGVPVICTDIEPYRCDLPVTRVSNRYKDWMNAIREHLADMDELAVRGDALRAAVHRDWMLRDEGLTDWQQAWLPQ